MFAAYLSGFAPKIKLHNLNGCYQFYVEYILYADHNFITSLDRFLEITKYDLFQLPAKPDSVAVSIHCALPDHSQLHDSARNLEGGTWKNKMPPSCPNGKM
jgi:hypothetical protein